MRRLVLAVALLALVTVTPAARAADPGPALRTPASRLAAALQCPATFTHVDHEPVLLVQGTNVKADEHWSWNYAKVLPDLGFDTCVVALPGRARGDIQLTSEYVVAAIRRIAALTGRRVDVIGHSQGSLQPRWAMRWWPDLPAKVDDYVSLAGSNHGIVAADGMCAGGSCFPAAWQMKSSSALLAALNRKHEDERGVAMTSIYSETDELVQPFETSALRGAANIVVQDICPGRPVDHVSLADDAVVFAFVHDALTHTGPASVSRAKVDCASAFMPGVTPADVLFGQARLYANTAVEVSTAQDSVDHEPALAPYAR
jgi:hypothetical protein